MNPEMVVSALLNLSNALEKSVELLNAMVNMIFAGISSRYNYKDQGMSHALLRYLETQNTQPPSPQAQHENQ